MFARSNLAGVEDQNVVTLKGTPTADQAAPTFGGVKTADAGGSGAITLKWDTAKDDLSAPGALSYLVYMSDAAGTEEFTRPVLVTPPGATSATVPRLGPASKARFFVVRARDAAGNVDTNAIEKSAQPGPDSVAPVFGGCTAATNVSALSIAVSWAPATDDVTSGAAITYDIFASLSRASSTSPSPSPRPRGWTW